MATVSELTSKNIANTQANVQTWGNIIVNVKVYGAKGDGVTDDTIAFQSAIDAASLIKGKVVCPPSISYVIDGTVSIKDDVEIDFMGSKITSQKTGVDLPVTFFTIDGDNIKIKNLKFEISLSQLDSSSRGRLFDFSLSSKTIFNNITISDCDIRYAFYGIYSYNKTINNLYIENNFFGCVRQDILLNKLYGKNININNNEFDIERNWVTPVTCIGQINIFSGIDSPVDASLEEMTDIIYENDYTEKIQIENNNFGKMNGRTIHVINSKNVKIEGNQLIGTIGDHLTAGVTDDVIAVEYCRIFNITNNMIDGSGENGIDILASKYGTVSHNILRNINTDGVHSSIGDIDALGYASTLNTEYRYPSDVTITENTIHAKVTCFTIRLGKNYRVTNNILSTYDIDAVGTFQIAFSTISTLIASFPTLKVENVYFDNNTRVDNKTNIYYQNKEADIVWGTLGLGKELAVESGWLTINANDVILFTHSKGLYKNIDVYFYIDPANLTTYGTNSTAYPIDRFLIRGKYTDNPDTGAKTRGTWPVFNDINQVIVKAGDYLVDVPQRATGQGSNMGNIITGSIKIATY